MSVSSSPIVIVKNRFFELGKRAPKESRFKGLITADSLVGLTEYYDREEANEYAEGELVETDQNFLAYTSRNGYKTFSQNGFVKNSEIVKEVRKHFVKDGNMAFDFILSLPDYETAKKLDLHSPNDYQLILARVMPKFFRKVGMDPANVIWWGNHHSNTDQPHCHIMFMEKNQTRTKGKFTSKQLRYLKLLIANEMRVDRIIDQDFHDRLKIKNQLYKEMTTRIRLMELLKEDDEIGSALIELYKKIPATGRLQYNSENIAFLKSEINKISDLILQTENLKPVYENWLTLIKKLDKGIDKTIGGESKNVQKNEMNELYSRIGNIILKSKYEYNDIIKGTHRMIQIPKTSMIRKSAKDGSVLIDLNRDDRAILKLSYTVQVSLKDKEKSTLLSYDKLDGATLIVNKQETKISGSELAQLLKSYKPTAEIKYSVDKLTGRIESTERTRTFKTQEEWNKAALAWHIKRQVESSAIRYLNKREYEIEQEIEKYLSS